MALGSMLHNGINKISAFRSKFFFNKTQVRKKSAKTTYLEEYDFDTNEEIVENFVNKVMLIGINLQEQKNTLTESALDRLLESIKKFSLEKDLTAAVLHGCGGNFCTGIELSENSFKKSDKVIKSLHDLKKPIVVSLSGTTTEFGCELAIMCDLKVMDETALIGFGENHGSMHSEVYKRLVATVGLSAAMLMVLTTCTWNAQEALENKLVNRIVSCGSSLGQAIIWAKSIAKSPVEVSIEQKSRILSLIQKPYSDR